MKTPLAILSAILWSLPVFAGGPDIDSSDLKVGNIITTDDEIIMQIDGSFRMLTLKAPEEDQAGGGNAKMVPLVIRDGILRIPKKKWKHPGGDKYEVYLDWDQYKKGIMKWEGKEITTQMWSTETIFRGGAPREIIAEVCKIWDRPEKK
jgi:hypothetical protein